MELREKIIKLINDFLESKGKDTRINEGVEDIIMTDLNFNSIEFIELIIILEEEFNCEFDDSLLSSKSFFNLNVLVNYISKIKDEQN